MPSPPKAFLDANIWYSAFYKSANCSKILYLGLEGKLKLFTSQQVIEEVAKNLKLKIPHTLPSFYRYLAYKSLTIAKNPTLITSTTKSLVHPKDAPILQACFNLQTPLFITGNLKHFSIARIHQLFHVQILNPKDFIYQFQP